MVYGQERLPLALIDGVSSSETFLVFREGLRAAEIDQASTLAG